jgi:hypothetical protein
MAHLVQSVKAPTESSPVKKRKKKKRRGGGGRRYKVGGVLLKLITRTNMATFFRSQQDLVRSWALVS